MTLSSALQWAAVALVAVLGVGRATRLITYDDYPPIVWGRIQWARLVRYSTWSKLVTCGWCASPYIAAICLVWFWLSHGTGWELSWWLVWGTLAVAYAGVMVMVRDDPHD